MNRCAVAALALVFLTLAGCGASDSRTAAPIPLDSTTSVTTPAHVQPTGTTELLQLNEASNGTTTHVRVGTTVLAVLNSTYWTFAPPAPSGILVLTASPAYAPAPIGTCVPGEGCGTVTANYAATNAGAATISATRVSCGEALACSGADASYSVTVVVTAG